MQRFWLHQAVAKLKQVAVSWSSSLRWKMESGVFSIMEIRLTQLSVELIIESFEVQIKSLIVEGLKMWLWGGVWHKYAN